MFCTFHRNCRPRYAWVCATAPEFQVTNSEFAWSGTSFNFFCAPWGNESSYLIGTHLSSRQCVV
ncbi:hypothetical protein M5D96_010669 [Drosophila gunungcola]|uniref:Uncharacterized protein n=1 Tax=Drosophila gunungcola TaxID=103775 RepID=A0A9P9YGW8_9MUSC|nr:hypothetical protein M5D96_010669 [Drosophila gunungcola]